MFAHEFQVFLGFLQVGRLLQVNLRILLELHGEPVLNHCVHGAVPVHGLAYLGLVLLQLVKGGYRQIVYIQRTPARRQQTGYHLHLRHATVEPPVLTLIVRALEVQTFAYPLYLLVILSFRAQILAHARIREVLVKRPGSQLLSERVMYQPVQVLPIHRILTDKAGKLIGQVIDRQPFGILAFLHLLELVIDIATYMVHHKPSERIVVHRIVFLPDIFVQFLVASLDPLLEFLAGKHGYVPFAEIFQK